MIASPAAMPSEPPMKSKSWTAETTGHALDRTGADENGIVQPGLGAGIAEAIGVAALVAEFERIERHVGEIDGLPRAVVEEMGEALPAGHPHVEAGAGNDEVVRLEIAMEDHLAGLGALDPKVLRHFPLGEKVADLRTDDVADPAHFSSSYSAASARAARTPSASSPTRRRHGVDGPRGRPAVGVERILDRAHQGRPDDDTVGGLADGARLRGRPDAETDRDRQYGVPLDPFHGLDDLSRIRRGRAGNAENRHVVDETRGIGEDRRAAAGRPWSGSPGG